MGYGERDIDVVDTFEGDDAPTVEAEAVHRAGAKRIGRVYENEIDNELREALSHTVVSTPLGQGAYRMVFDISHDENVTEILDNRKAEQDLGEEDFPNGWVIKVDVRATRRLFENAQRKDKRQPLEAAAANLDALSAEERYDEVTERRGYHRFSDTFNSENVEVLPEMWQAQMVWMPARYYLQILGKSKEEVEKISVSKMIYVPVWCSFQPKMEEERTIDVGSGSWEVGMIDAARDPITQEINSKDLNRRREVYNRFMDAYVFGDTEEEERLTPSEIKRMLPAFGEQGKRLRKLLEAIDKSDEDGTNVREVMEEFVKAAIYYSQGDENDPADRMIDVYGKENVRLVPIDEQGNVKCQMVDGYLPMFREPFKTMTNVFEMNPPGEPIALGVDTALQTISYVRTINLLAHYLGLEERIHIVQPDQEFIDAGLSTVEEEQAKVTEMLRSRRNGNAKIFESAVDFYASAIA